MIITWKLWAIDFQKLLNLEIHMRVNFMAADIEVTLILLLFSWNYTCYSIEKLSNKFFIYFTGQNSLMLVIRFVINVGKFDHLSILRFGFPTSINLEPKRLIGYLYRVFTLVVKVCYHQDSNFCSNCKTLYLEISCPVNIWQQMQ